MKAGLVFDQFIELFAYFVFIITTLLMFDKLKGWSVIFGLVVFVFIKLLVYKFLYKLKKC